MVKNVGWIGTGVMGLPMAHHIFPLATNLYLYNRSPEKTQSLVAKGATLLSSPAQVAQQANLIFTMVGFPSDVEEVYFGPEGIFTTLQEGTILVDMTTTKPSLAQKIATEAAKKGCFILDAPVSGGDVGAREARLSIMVGGEKEVFDQLLPYFQKMGRATLQGGAGKGQHTKMCNQIVIAGTMVGVCEALLYGERSGLDGKTLLATIGAGAAGCWTLDNLAPRVLQSDFGPGFMVDHFVKDMQIALEESERMGIALPGLALVEQLYTTLQALGGGKLGTQALILALRKLNSNE
ncbi:MAG: NAD(P)-dependent oxidoreductase [Sphaerochaetaceae bacterium]|jgi:3-hydroxyisobutyrate dehydrogenase|nr:NAD(P)-dependent oxidoreductase [Sphaerochaetaceae bacterium]HHU87895.1 NAD(P)-dependent oxidoreductase [Spirochaetales bacterium]